MIPPDAPTPLQRPRRLSHGFAAAVLVSLAAGLLVEPFRRVTDYFLSVRFEMNDWEYLWLSMRPERELQRLAHFEMFRPVVHLVWATLHQLFGPAPLPLAVVFFLCNLLGAVLIALVFIESGFAPLLASFAALMAFFGNPNLDSGAFLACNDTPMGRLAIAATLLAFLRWRPGRRRWWVLFLVVAFATHEIAVTTLPLALLCLWHRDGLRKVVRERGELLRFGAVFALVLGARYLLYLHADSVSHALGFSAVQRNVQRLWEDAAHFAYHSRDWPQQPVSLRVAQAVILLGVLWQLRTAAFWRGLAFALGWTIAAFGPYFLAASYYTRYFVALSSFGLALAVAWMVIGAARALTVPATRWGLALAFLPFAVGIDVWDLRSRPPVLYDLVIPHAQRAIAAAGSGTARVFFIGEENAQSEWMRDDAYAEMIGARETTNSMFEVLFPNRRVASSFLRPVHLPWLCARPGEVAVRVNVFSPWPWRITVEGAPGCGESAPLPPALADGSTLRSSLPNELADTIREFWRAHAANDRRREEWLAKRVRSLGASSLGAPLGGSGASEAVRAAVEAVEAVAPSPDAWGAFWAYHPGKMPEFPETYGPQAP
jgi:hypothetical protein